MAFNWKCKFCAHPMTRDETPHAPKDWVAVCDCGAEYHHADLTFEEDPWRSPDFMKGVGVGLERGRVARMEEDLAKVKEARQEIWRAGYDAGKGEAEEQAERERPDLARIRQDAFELGHRAGVEEIHGIQERIREEILRGVVRDLHAGGIRQVDLAQALGISQPTISRMLRLIPLSLRLKKRDR